MTAHLELPGHLEMSSFNTRNIFFNFICVPLYYGLSNKGAGCNKHAGLHNFLIGMNVYARTPIISVFMTSYD